MYTYSKRERGVYVFIRMYVYIYIDMCIYVYRQTEKEMEPYYRAPLHKYLKFVIE